MAVYTDGITEATNCAGLSYGIERLCEVLKANHGLTVDRIREAVRSSLREYTGGRALLDDISLLVVKPA
jgi:serine phosphatase RsbU (regulator of sigma subunit)